MSNKVLDLDQPRYDQTEFKGRLLHFMDITNPLNLLVTPSQLQQYQELVKNYQDKPYPVLSKEEEEILWKAKRIVDSTCHPETKEPIFLPFRMSAFVPLNLIICAGLLIPKPTFANIVFWQWFNQSTMVAINWANANKSTPMSVSETATAYCTAVGASVGTALGLDHLVKKSKLSPAVNKILSKSVPFLAVSTASVLNVFLMRRKEIKEGISVTDEFGNIVGKSKAAGLNAVSQVATTRVALVIPVLLLPPLIMSRMEKTRFLKANPRWNVPIQLGIITTSLLTALPCSIAIFPQKVQSKVQDLEPHLQNLKNKDGSDLKYVYYNKGL